ARANTSGWCRSKAGRSERTRSRVTKLCRGGGQEVAHSRELPCPHGSSTVTFGACRQVLYTFHRNGSVETASSTAEKVDTWFIQTKAGSGRECWVRNGPWKPKSSIQKWIVPSLSSSIMPVSLGHQK